MYITPFLGKAPGTLLCEGMRGSDEINMVLVLKELNPAGSGDI